MPRPAGHLSYLHICRCLFTSTACARHCLCKQFGFLRLSGNGSTYATDVLLNQECICCESFNLLHLRVMIHQPVACDPVLSNNQLHGTLA